MTKSVIGWVDARRDAVRSHYCPPIRPNRLDDDRRDGRRRSGTARVRLGRAGARGGAAAHHARIGGRLRRRTGCDGLPARGAARVRCRPHRRDRQHHPQAGRGGHAVAIGRILVLARPFQRRVRAGVPSCARRARGRGTGSGRGFADVADARVGGFARRGYLPHPHRADEPVRRGGHRQGVPPYAQR